ncbi:alanine--tRNA ligase [bacterium]|nr:alanine--tRNA ligase [bacterium]
MPGATSQQIRSDFIKFFEKHGHKFVTSSSVVPLDDPTLLFTNAGMNQFKPIFLGSTKSDYTRAVNSQKCIRVSGKHNDLEEVGHDTYHHTFFEMLGNWSFGDYYKKEAITWAWELFTKEWGLPKERLYATVYKDDTEAEELWKQVTDINPSHVMRFGEKDNFWEMGETGPCGPCSEIHIDLTPNGDGGRLVNAGSSDVIELWNLVFIQYNRNADRSLTPLPSKHVDTGAGFERVVRVLQNKQSNYDIDIFTDIIHGIESRTKKSYETAVTQPSFRVIADHLRMLTFSITDGAVPGNDGRGYVLRRILRRASMYGRKLDMREPFIHDLVKYVVQSMGDAFPEIKSRQSFVEKVIKTEEENFNRTLDRGIEVFEDVVRQVEKKGFKMIAGDDVFKLYDTYGFPFDLTRVMAAERGLSVDENQFTEAMTKQKERSREEGKKKFVAADIKWKQVNQDVKTKFLGYDTLASEAHLIKYHRDGHQLQLILDQTPFYAESGGQVGDKGVIEFNGTKLEVWDTQKINDVTIHFVDDPEDLNIENYSAVQLKVLPEHRNPTIKNHSATHLLHAALRSVLGDHVHQAGSVVEPSRLRFDFSHFEKLSVEQIEQIERIVNQKIRENIPLQHHRNIPISQAKQMGALSFFGDKYGEWVNVVQFGEFSKEFCGGTHVPSTGFIGFFKIISESSIASGVRRIEAVTGELAEKMIHEALEISDKLQALLTCKSNEIIDRVGHLITERKNLEKELGQVNLKIAALEIDTLIKNAREINGFKVVSEKVDLPQGVELKSMGDSLREKLKSGVGVLAASNNGNIAFVCVVTDDLIKSKNLNAGNLIKEIAKIAGGSGGGRPHLATAGGKEVDKLKEALNKLFELVK